MNDYYYPISLTQRKVNQILMWPQELIEFTESFTVDDYSFQRFQHRDLWFRISDREYKCFPIANYDIPDKFYASRIIIRAGYFFQPKDKQSYEKPIKEMTQILLKHRLKKTFDLPELPSDTTMKIFESVAGEGALKKAIYDVRRLWCDRGYYVIPDYTEHKNIRTFWYLNLPDKISENIRFENLGLTQKMVGVRYPPTGDYDFYDPGGLHPCARQTVVRARAIDYVRDYDYFDLNEVDYYIHPEDIGG